MGRSAGASRWNLLSFLFSGSLGSSPLRRGGSSSSPRSWGGSLLRLLFPAGGVLVDAVVVREVLVLYLFLPISLQSATPTRRERRGQGLSALPVAAGELWRGAVEHGLRTSLVSISRPLRAQHAGLKLSRRPRSIADAALASLLACSGAGRRVG
ncbi:hypothetical protein BCR35DRAFT_43819 [Leucosporidium creatinivorum]|uniref:Uncharacterized protein n=1 Tax=Leucosporidium creatinivorum TaxID=106004 RepID=A0A1Y2FRN7_9BASI|nr:hypothetical protein BCR35DRAFT_43819 [Leucosporidium creatinivorum]